MKKKILFSLSLLMIIGLVTGCGKAKEKLKSSINLEKGKFSIVCSTDESDEGTMKIKNETTYNFNEDQYAINYAVVTTQKFKDKSVYKTYKESQEETVKGSNDDVVYDLQSDDKSKTLVFTMAITNTLINKAESDEEKEKLKASSILKNSEGTCKTVGIDESEIK